MSNQSGITCSAELIGSFKKYIDTKARSLVIKVENEELVSGELIQGTDSLDNDWELIRNVLGEKEPAFVVVKKSDQSKEHLFISYTPDYAPVRSKMIYASSKNTLLRELGLEFFKPIIFISDLDEISSTGWNSYLAHENLQNPLTREEESLQKVKDFEHLSIGTERRTKQLVNDSSSVFVFKITDDLRTELSSLKEGQLISCSIDTESESITASKNSSFSTPQELVNEIGLALGPQYTILKFHDKNTFIYSCPSGSKVKDRMIYASNKNGFVNQLLKKELGLDIANVVEVGDLDEVELSIFDEEAEAVSSSDAAPKSLRFSRPKGPRRK